jgi:hypothetical protein
MNKQTTDQASKQTNKSINLFHPFDNNDYRVHLLFLVLSFDNSN